MLDALQTEGRSFSESYLLNTCVIKDLKSDKNETSFSSPIEALELICQKPELLNSEEYQRLFEMAIFKTHDLQRLLRINPEYLLTIAPQIKLLIERHLRSENPRPAAFLMHIGSGIFRHAQAALQSDPQLYRLDQDFSPGSDVKLLDQLPGFLKKIMMEFPTYDTQYKLPDSSLKRGYEILKLLATKPNNPRKFLYTFFLEWFYETYKTLNFSPSNPADTKNIFEELGEEALAVILYGYAILKNDGVESGLPMIQKQEIQWLEYEFIPSLWIYISGAQSGETQRKLQKLFNTFLHLAGLDLNLSDSWKPAKVELCIFENGPVSINFKTGLIKMEKGQAAIQGEKAFLPVGVTKSPDYRQLLAVKKSPPIASLAKLRENSSIHFIFKEAAELASNSVSSTTAD